MKSTCKIEGCDKTVHGHGWCDAHYARWIRNGDPIVNKRTPNGLANKFLREVVLKHTEDTCLIWPFAKSHGYAVLYSKKGTNIVSRIICRRLKGPPPTPKHEAAHSCGKGKKGCVSPQHLRWATSIENQHDKILHGTDNRGERHGHSKLNEKSVRKIRLLKGKMFQKDIAKIFGVRQITISQIFTRRTWAWLS